MSAEGAVWGALEPAAAERRREAWAPVLLGALAGSLVAGRLETVLITAAVALAGAVALRADRPAPRTIVTLGITLAIAVAANLYLVHGRALPLPRLFGLEASAEGLRFGLLLAARLLGAAIAMHALAALWAAERAADELAGRLSLLKRLGLPLDELRAVLSLALRFVPLIGAEARRIERVQALRAGRPPRGVRERLTRARAALTPTLVAALERADQVALALSARHYRQRPPRVTPWPWAASLAGFTLLLGALLWRG